jgi:hypothetical protein
MIQNLKKSLYNLMNGQQNTSNNALDFNALQTALEELKILEGKKLATYNLKHQEAILEDLNKAEFKVFSQWGDDGIIQFLVDYLDIEHKIFVEFGVENYKESNTRFLLLNNCWKGMVLDGSEDNIRSIKQSNLYWQYQLEACCSFITKDNINSSLTDYLKTENLGVLVIDVDGNDYWIWDAINNVKPILVVVEYNSLFGYERAITIPYQADFKRNAAHFTNLYYGASLAALTNLANKKGYALVACNKNGNNAFFVRKDKMKQLKELSVAQAYKPASFRESRDKNNKLTYLNFEGACKAIKDLPVFNISTLSIESF